MLFFLFFSAFRGFILGECGLQYIQPCSSSSRLLHLSVLPVSASEYCRAVVVTWSRGHVMVSARVLNVKTMFSAEMFRCLECVVQLQS